MRVMVWIVALFFSIALLTPGEARAATAAQSVLNTQPVFATSVVADEELAGMRGTAAPFGRLTAGAVQNVADDEARGAFHQMGQINRVTMDIWWGSTGADLIAANVRALAP